MKRLGIITLLFLFAESGGQVAGKQNFQLSDVVNILVSVTGTRKVPCLLLYSAWHKSDGYQLISLSRSAVLGFKVRPLHSVIVSQIQTAMQGHPAILYHNYSLAKVGSLRISVKYRNINWGLRAPHLPQLPSNWLLWWNGKQPCSWQTLCLFVLPGWGGEFELEVLSLSYEMQVPYP